MNASDPNLWLMITKLIEYFGLRQVRDMGICGQSPSAWSPMGRGASQLDTHTLRVFASVMSTLIKNTSYENGSGVKKVRRTWTFSGMLPRGNFQNIYFKASI